ncbi:MAG: pyridoxal phosphate-dependent aminotransferase [Deltaproteobacteria bacterium]|nr:pyridoxal phosphate-dependent aminotransferase [Deltaproteobacteria bacterium]
MIPISSRLNDVTPFQAMEIFQLAGRLEAQGRHIVHMEFGEPDFDTPQVVRQAAATAISGGRTHYTHSLGLPEFRQEISDYYQKRYGVKVDPGQVLVSQGTSILTQLVLLLLVEPGDEVILTDPAYACYANYVRIAGGTPVFVRLREEDGFQVDPAAVRRAVTPRTRAVMICSPANPTGSVLEPAVLKELGQLEIPILSDEIYHGLTYEGEEHTMLAYSPRAFVLNGFSKYFAMTGWRLGYMIFPQEVTGPLMRLHQNIMISAAEPAQLAGLAALRHALPQCEAFKEEYARRRAFMLGRLGEIGLPLHYTPRGAFYAFVNARRLGENSLELAKRILVEAGVALTPGIDFGPGGEGYLRLSYANSMENLAEGLNRLETFVKDHG